MTPSRRKLLLFGVVSVAALALLVIFWPRHPKAVLPSALASESEQSKTVSKGDPAPQMKVTIKAREKLEKDLRAQYTMPLSVYGKVVDEVGAPVSGANVEIIWTDLSERGTSRANITSGPDGRFSLTDVKGKSGSVRVQKAGYHERQDINSSSFNVVDEWESNFYKPDSANPIVFVLQKRLPAESITRWTNSYHFHAKEGVAYFDLSTGKPKSSKDADLIVKYAATRLGRGLPYYAWRCEVAVPNGGLLVRGNDFGFLAPENGYVASDAITMQADAERYQWDGEREYFVRARDGQLYARVIVKMTVGDDPFVLLTAYVNPSGSRNLDYDPVKQVKP